MDPFATLGFSPSFVLEANVISARKVELSKALHPDRFVGRPASERRAALLKSLEVNEAARRLLDPVTRAEALLEQLGCSNAEEHTPQPAADFLMEIMELRQELREAGRARDVARIEALSKRVQVSNAATLKKLEDVFVEVTPQLSDGQKSDGAFELDAAWKGTVFGLLSELRYFRRFFDEAEAYLDEI